MSVEPAVLFRSMEQLLSQGTVAGLDERALLERFANHRDGRALAVLIATHGPMVLGVCRRILREPQDIEDAFQSTFLILARRAGSIRDPGRLAAWLHGVARRVALRARGQFRKRAADGHDQIAILEDPSPGAGLAAERAELLGLIDAELARLPRRYRDVLVLCDLEGRTYTEAAHHLGCPLGTVQSRLARGRKQLRGRLQRKGLEPATSAALLSQMPASSVPRALTDATLRVCEAAWQAGGAPTAALSLAEWSRTLTGTACRRIAAVVIVTVALGASLAAYGFGNRPAQAPDPPPASAPQAPEPVADQQARSATARCSRRSAPPRRTSRCRTRRSGFERGEEGPMVPDNQGGRTDRASMRSTWRKGHSGTWKSWPPRTGTSRNRSAGAARSPRDLRPGVGTRPEDGRQGRRRAGASNCRSSSASVVRVTRWRRGCGRCHRRSGSMAVRCAAILGSGRRKSSRLDLIAGQPSRSCHGDRGRHRRSGAKRGRSVLTMKQGVSIAGSVVGPEGQPIEGASVVIEQMVQRRASQSNRDRLPPDSFISATAIDPEGPFHGSDREGAGLAAVVRNILVTPSIPRQTIQLMHQDAAERPGR